MTRLCLALDTQTPEQAVEWVASAKNTFDTFKVGLEYFTANGWSGLQALRDEGAQSIFLDLKLHDIPRTVERTILAMEGRCIDYLTIHLAGGREMLRASQRAAEAVGISLLGVSVLTSLGDVDLEETGVIHDTWSTVEKRCRLASSCGLFGIVSSPREVSKIKQNIDPNIFCLTPGIRFDWDEKGDQKRVTTPQQALDAGSDMLVLGRAFTRSPDRNRVLDALSEFKNEA